MAIDNVLSIILVGGQGTRLMPHTKYRAKSAVPFGALYRIVDFSISNMYNSGVPKVLLLAQYKPKSLLDHVDGAFTHLFGSGHKGFIRMRTAPDSSRPEFYMGTAHALTYHLDEIVDEKARDICVFAGDHVTFMDVGQFVDFHREKDADLTIGVIAVPSETAVKQYGVLEIDADCRVRGYTEKPGTIGEVREIPDRPGWCLASMGNYVFKNDILVKEVEALAAKEIPMRAGRIDRGKVEKNPDRYTSGDFGRDVIPGLLERSKNIFAYPLDKNSIPGVETPFWADVGTIKSNYETNLLMTETKPPLNMFNPHWPIHTNINVYSPTKIVFDEHPDRVLFGMGVIMSGSRVSRCVIGSHTRIEKAYITDSVIFGETTINADRKSGVRIHRAIIDKNVKNLGKAPIGIDVRRDIAGVLKPDVHGERYWLFDLRTGEEITPETLKEGYVPQEYLTIVPRDYVFE